MHIIESNIETNDRILTYFNAKSKIKSNRNSIVFPIILNWSYSYTLSSEIKLKPSDIVNIRLTHAAMHFLLVYFDSNICLKFLSKG